MSAVSVLHLTPKPGSEHKFPGYKLDAKFASEVMEDKNPDFFYKLVATVDTGTLCHVETGELLSEEAALEYAFEKTNHVYGDWTENLYVYVEPGQGRSFRSTSVGDVMRTDSGRYFMVAPFGFSEFSWRL